MTPTTTRAAVLYGRHDIRIERIPLRPLGPEILVGNLRCGPCGTDLAKWRGDEEVNSPQRLGHEFAGVVIAVGRGVTNVQIGDQVACWIPPGWDYGGLAEYAIVPARYAVGAPRDVGWAAEPLMCVIAAAKRVGRLIDGTHKGKRVVIIGTGTMALLTTAFLARRQPPRSLTVIGRSDAGLHRARALGATAIVKLPLDDPDRIADAIGKPADVVYEAVGNQDALTVASCLPRMGGIVCVLGYHQSGGGDRTIPVGPVMGWRGVSFVSGHTRDAATAGLSEDRDEVLPALKQAARLLTRGEIDVDVLRARDGGTPVAFPLDAVADAFEWASRPGAGKVVVDGILA